MASVQAAERVTDMVEAVTRVESPTLDSQMVAGDELHVMVGGCWALGVEASPDLSDGYWSEVPKSQGSWVPGVTESRSMSQSLYMSLLPIP